MQIRLSYGDFFWLGVPFFDRCHDWPPPYMARDAGKDDATGKFIYTIGGEMVNIVPMRNRKWIHVKADLLSHVKKGLAQAVGRGYLTSGRPQDCAVVNMNMGWEIPGTHDAVVWLARLWRQIPGVWTDD